VLLPPFPRLPANYVIRFPFLLELFSSRFSPSSFFINGFSRTMSYFSCRTCDLQISRTCNPPIVTGSDQISCSRVSRCCRCSPQLPHPPPRIAYDMSGKPRPSVPRAHHRLSACYGGFQTQYILRILQLGCVSQSQARALMSVDHLHAAPGAPSHSLRCQLGKPPACDLHGVRRLHAEVGSSNTTADGSVW
jgi:hypothetical protein